jgi:hypothetical protein
VESRSKRASRKWLLGGLAGLLLVAALGMYGLKVYLPGVVYARVREHAGKAGIDLQHCEGFEFVRDGLNITKVTLSRCEFNSALPMQPMGTVEQIDCDLADNAPTRIGIAGADVTVSGEPRWFELQAGISAPAGVEVVAQRVRISWVESVGSSPRVQISDLEHLTADGAWTGKVSIGSDVRGEFVAGNELALTLQYQPNPNNVLRLRLEPARFFGSLSLELDGLPMTVLSGVVFHNMPPDMLTVQLTGSAKFDLPFGLNPKQPKGHFKFTFDGLTFPVPREVAGLVYDTAPEIEGDIVINRTFSNFKVDRLSFVTGSLRMQGTASIEREGTETRWRSTLRGPLPCGAIAAAAAKIHLKGLPLGDELAHAASRISKQALKGSVDIFVALDAHSTDLAAAKIIKTIGVGCGLKPFPLLAAAHDLVKELPAISFGGSKVGDMLKDLPSLSQLPELPTIPGINKTKQAAEPTSTSTNND